MPHSSEIHEAIKSGDIEKAISLIKSFSSTPSTLKQVDENGKTPMQLAAIHGHANVIASLHEIDNSLISEADSGGHLPIHLVSQHGRKDALQKLIQLNSPIKHQTKHGLEPIHLAARYGHWHLFEQLKSYGINLDTTTRDQYTPLHFAAQYANSVQSLKQLVALGANVNARTKFGDTPLHLATSYAKNFNVLNSLINLGADTNALNNSGKKPIEAFIQRTQSSLRTAILKQDDKLLKCLVKLGADIDAYDDNNPTPLQLIVSQYMRTSWIELLINLKANVNASNSIQNTALHTAATYDNNKAIITLHKHGADLDVKNFSGHTPLHVAASYNNRQAIKQLHALGANINAEDNTGETPLHIAVLHNNSQAIQQLYELGANINAENNKGETPLHTAIRGNNLDTINQLIELKANLNAKNKFNETPLHISIKHGFTDAAILLIKSKASLDEEDLTDNTPLDLAIKNNNPTIVQELVNSKANINSENVKGVLPIETAIAFKHPAIIEILLMAKVNIKDVNLQPYIDSVDRDGNTPLHLAAQRGDAKMVEILLEIGADKNVLNNSGAKPINLALSQGVPVQQTAITSQKSTNFVDVVALLEQEALDLSGTSFRVERGLSSLLQLVTHGGDANAILPDGHNNAPLHLAIKWQDKKSDETSAILPNGKDNTPLHLATKSQHEKSDEANAILPNGNDNTLQEKATILAIRPGDETSSTIISNEHFSTDILALKTLIEHRHVISTLYKNSFIKKLIDSFYGEDFIETENLENQHFSWEDMAIFGHFVTNILSRISLDFSTHDLLHISFFDTLAHAYVTNYHSIKEQIFGKQLAYNSIFNTTLDNLIKFTMDKNLYLEYPGTMGWSILSKLFTNMVYTNAFQNNSDKNISLTGAAIADLMALIGCYGYSHILPNTPPTKDMTVNINKIFQISSLLSISMMLQKASRLFITNLEENYVKTDVDDNNENLIGKNITDDSEYHG